MEKDLQKKGYFYVPERFADLINGVLCAGRQIRERKNITKTNELMQIKEYGEKEGKVDMCMAITELIERGRRQGMEQGIEQVIRAMIEASRELGSTKEETTGRIIEKIQISADEAEMYVGRYWA